MRNLLILWLVAAAACAAADSTRSAALSREQAAVLIATLDEAAPRALASLERPAERRRLKKQIFRLRRAFERGDADQVLHATLEFRRAVREPGAAIEFVVREAEAAVQGGVQPE